MFLTGLNFHNRERRIGIPRIPERFQHNISNSSGADRKVAAKLGQLNRSTWEKGKSIIRTI